MANVAMTPVRTLGKHPAHIPTNAKRPVYDALAYIREYAQEKPEVAAFCCLGIGFVLGWKLKLW